MTGALRSAALHCRHVQLVRPGTNLQPTERNCLICGISGFSLARTDVHSHDRVKRLTRSLLLGIEERGTDATGIAWNDQNGKMVVQKRDIEASKFIRQISPWRHASTVLAHTRLATQGSTVVRANNHPIVTGNIVGIHNGMVYNDDRLFRDMGIEELRIAQVDSEAIFAAIAYGADVIGKEEVPDPEADMKILKPVHRLAADIPGVLSHIEGTAAIAWVDEEYGADILHLARINSSPLVWAQNAEGSFFFASTQKALARMAEENKIRFVHTEHAKEGTYLRVHNGMVTDCTTFEPARSYRYSNGYTNWWDDDEFIFGNGRSYKVTGRGDVVELPRHNLAHGDTALPPKYLDMRAIHPEAKEQIPRLGPGQHTRYAARERTIDKWFDDHKHCTDGKILGEAFDHHAFLHEGDWVTTTFMGEDIVGQVYDLPNSFPEGVYTLMLYVGNRGRETGVERVIVRRYGHEFFQIENKDDNREKVVASILNKSEEDRYPVRVS